ncbi:hypothetical protein QVD17_14171 [Tagetes erecta]|uniref:COP1-interacting protein 7 n=1 Tax=Tagetes erecta TaxID=13708 RepID=A0AAD8KXV9_TARER|nr:hypothetical protein QVD17_14171 [Tagetes erecta]
MTMDPTIRLDYALFQLTPTRTRCDLLICGGECKEKLASGLLEPFIAHLKFVKDEVLKGGYSVTLSAPHSASWFTKSTLERFVRFVSTPEVLERFVIIEREMQNIEWSINNNGLSDSQSVYSLDEHLNKSAAFAQKHEEDSLNEEDSKLHLQRVLESRKAVLQREQAMVYARALVVGFETDVLQDLICFADAFGSPRLREACLNFLELCNTKSNDRVWMDEVAAMQACSRSQYSYMEDDLATELRINVQNGNLATKIYNGSVDGISNESHLPQYMHSYHAGPMYHPSYQGYPFPYYQGNLPWPANTEDSRSRTRRSRKKRSQELTQDGNSDSSDSGGYKRSSAKKVIIKNINYINSSRNEESEHESEADQSVDNTVEEKHEGQKVKQQWDIFQNLLLMDVDDKESEEEHVSHKFDDQNIIPSGNEPEFTTISSTIGKHEETDWYLRSQPDKETQDRTRDIFEDRIKVVESTKDVLDKYPLTVEPQSLNGYSDSQLKTHDSLMFPESNLTRKTVEAPHVNEPNDLHMVLDRGTTDQQDVPAWTPEMELDSSNNKIVKMDSPEVNKSKIKASVEKKGSTVEAKSKALVESRRKPPAETKTPILKGRSAKEEERRKKMEELLTQRQRRIAERSATASTAKTAKNNNPKRHPTTKNDKPKAQQAAKNNKPKVEEITKNDKPKAQQTAKNFRPKAQQITKNEKPKAQQTPTNNTPKVPLASRDMKSSKKTVIRSSTIDRLSAARVVNPKVLPTESKSGNKPVKAPAKRNGEPKPVYKPTKVTIKENKVLKPDKVKPLDKNTVSKNTYGPKKKPADQNKSKQLPKASEIKKTGNGVSHTGLSTPASVVPHKDITLSDSKGGSTTKAVNSVSFKLNEDINGGKRNCIAKMNHQIPAVEILTSVAAKASPEKSNSRKKWSSLETPSKALSTFKKLLSFGKRS